MRKKILFCITNFKIGGIGRACCDLLSALIREYDIDLLAFDDKGPLKSEIPYGVNLLPTNNRMRILGESQSEIKNRGFIAFIIRAIAVVWAKLFGNAGVFRWCFKKSSFLFSYDLAVAYTQNGSDKFLYGGCPEYVLGKVKAKAKLAFIHDDFRRPEVRSKKNLALYSRFTHIAVLSKELRNFIGQYLPLEKLVVLPNVLNLERMEEAADCPSEALNFAGIRFLTVARLAQEKGIERALDAFASLPRDLAFHWYIVGKGQSKQQIESKITELGLSDRISLLGEKANPYPYYRQADWYLMCSYNEAFPVVIDEAHLFGLPAIIAEYTSYPSQALPEDIIVPNRLEELTSAIATAASSPKKKATNDNKTLLRQRNDTALAVWRKLIP